MILKEEKKQNYNLELYIIRLLNRIYYLISCTKESKQDTYYEQLNQIRKEFNDNQEEFEEIEKEQETNEVYKMYKYIVTKEYEDKLEKIYQELLKEAKIEKNLLGTILSLINDYTLLLDNKEFDLNNFKNITDFISELIYNFDKEAVDVLYTEIAYLFLGTFNKIGLNNLDKLIDNTNNYFYPSIISIAENYLFKAIFKNSNDAIYLELLEFKKSRDTKEYIKILYEQSYKFNK